MADSLTCVNRFSYGNNVRNIVHIFCLIVYYGLLEIADSLAMARMLIG